MHSDGTENRRSGKTVFGFLSYRVWLIAALVLWICILIIIFNNGGVRRERLRMGVSWDSCGVVMYEVNTGRDETRYLHLDELVGFETNRDGWMSFSDGVMSSGILPADLLSQYADLPLMDHIAGVQTGLVLFIDETPRSVRGTRVLNFTLAVYDPGAKELFYLEYNS